jgi:hypothetical protein
MIKSTWPSVVRSLILRFWGTLRIWDFDEIEIFIYTKYTKYPNFRCFQYIILYRNDFYIYEIYEISEFSMFSIYNIPWEWLKVRDQALSVRWFWDFENLRFRWNRDFYIYEIYEIYEFSMFSIYNITWEWFLYIRNIRNIRIFDVFNI